MTGERPATLDDQRRIIEGLLREVYTEEGVQLVMRSRNRMLEMRAPLSWLQEGQYEYVREWAEGLARGMDAPQT